MTNDAYRILFLRGTGEPDETPQAVLERGVDPDTDGRFPSHLVDPRPDPQQPLLGRWRLLRQDDERREAVYLPEEL